MCLEVGAAKNALCCVFDCGAVSRKRNRERAIMAPGFMATEGHVSASSGSKGNAPTICWPACGVWQSTNRNGAWSAAAHGQNWQQSVHLALNEDRLSFPLEPCIGPIGAAQGGLFEQTFWMRVFGLWTQIGVTLALQVAVPTRRRMPAT